MSSEPTPARARSSRPLKELAFLFLRLGTTAFGGPAAHIAMMEEEVVARRRWLSREKFLDLLGATNLIPGPNSTEMAIHIGYLRAGWAGLIVAGSSFIFPAVILVLAIAWAYKGYGTLPEVAGVLYGVKPVIIAVVLQALVRLARTAVKTKELALMAVVAVALNLVGVGELAVLFGIGTFNGLRRWLANRLRRSQQTGMGVGLAPLFAFGLPAGFAAGAAAPFGLWPLFLFFAKVGSVLFGSGYVLLAFLRADLVERWHWLTDGELLDAIAVSQVTPGPVFTAATFIGYLLGGGAGAAVATLGIFLPAFFFVALSGPLVGRIRRWPTAGAFLDGVIAASLALMVVVTWELGRSALADPVTFVLAAVSAYLLSRLRVNSAWLVLGGGSVGWLLR